MDRMNQSPPKFAKQLIGVPCPGLNSIVCTLTGHGWDMWKYKNIAAVQSRTVKMSQWWSCQCRHGAGVLMLEIPARVIQDKDSVHLGLQKPLWCIPIRGWRYICPNQGFTYHIYTLQWAQMGYVDTVLLYVWDSKCIMETVLPVWTWSQCTVIQFWWSMMIPLEDKDEDVPIQVRLAGCWQYLDTENLRTVTVSYRSLNSQEVWMEWVNIGTYIRG